MNALELNYESSTSTDGVPSWYVDAIAEVSRLIEMEDFLNELGLSRLESLARTIQDYERETCPIEPATAEALADYENAKRGDLVPA